MTEVSSVETVLLVRHASRQPRWDLPEEFHAMKSWSDEKFQALVAYQRPDVVMDSCPPEMSSPVVPMSDFKTSGFNRTVSIAGYLAELLQRQGVNTGVKIYHGCYLSTVQTAKIYQQVLAKFGLDGGMQSVPWLDPEPKTDEALCEYLRCCMNEEKMTKAIMFVGHQPDLSFIARLLLSPKKLPADTLPLGGSEVACLELGKGARLRWMLTEKSSDQLAELKSKIQAKYDVAKFFLGAFVVNTGLILSTDIWSEAVWPNRVFAYLAVLSAGAALILTAATLFSYDELLMPSDYWGTADNAGKELKAPKWNVERPPCQQHVVIFYEMVHIWNFFFRYALLAAFASIAFFVLAVAYVEPPTLITDGVTLGGVTLEGGLIILAVVFVLVALYGIYQWKRPKLGISD